MRISLKILSSFQINRVPLRIIHAGGPWALLFKAIKSFQVSPAFQVSIPDPGTMHVPLDEGALQQ